MTDLDRAARVLAGGGVALVPAETVYGLSGDARRPDVAARIHQLKGSDPTKPLLALTDRWERVEDWVEAPDPVRRVWAAPSLAALTLVLPATRDCPPALSSDEGYAGIRRSASSTVCELVEAVGRPLFSTSANPTGEAPPARLEDVAASILRGVDIALRSNGPLGGQPSTVARFDPGTGSFEILRAGPVSERDLRAVLEA